MRITIRKDETKYPHEMSKLSSSLVARVRGTITYEAMQTLHVDGLTIREAKIALDVIKPYLA